MSHFCNWDTVLMEGGGGVGGGGAGVPFKFLCPQDISCHVWLKPNHTFFRRWKYEKFYGQSGGRMDGSILLWICSHEPKIWQLITLSVCEQFSWKKTLSEWIDLMVSSSKCTWYNGRKLALGPLNKLNHNTEYVITIVFIKSLQAT